MNDILVIDGDEIVEIVQSKSGDVEPSERTQGNNSALIEKNGKPYISVFAGGLKGEQAVQDRNLYLFDTDEHTWEIVKVKIDETLAALSPFSSQPPTVQGHAMTALGSKILIHGGINGTTLYGGFHWIDLNKESEDAPCCWKDSDIEIPTALKPPARAAHGLAKMSDVDKNCSTIYMFGGLRENGACNDLWSFDNESNTWKEVLPNEKGDCSSCPQPRLDFAMCSVSLKDEEGGGTMRMYVMVHGGMNPQGDLFNDAWIMRVQ